VVHVRSLEHSSIGERGGMALGKGLAANLGLHTLLYVCTCD